VLDAYPGAPTTVPRPSEFRQDLAPELDAIILKALSASPIPGGTAGHRYRLITTSSSWQAHRDLCALDGAFLAIPGELSELGAILVLAGSTIWVGINDLVVENTFVDVLDMPATFLPWSAGQPDNDPPGEDCVLASNVTTQLTDERCADPHRAVCECIAP